MDINRPIILVSKSPRRKEILNQINLEFETCSVEIEEIPPEDLSPQEVALYLAKEKSRAYLKRINDEIIITADTIVTIDNKILGKPANYEEAYEMLQTLSGKCHEVITGVCLRSKENTRLFAETTKVYFNDLTDSEIKKYITDYEPYDKAGGYGIQEWIGKMGINRIEGCYNNVVGLPGTRLYKELKELIESESASKE
ncbi:septum formation protein Maf [Candidatus Amoebophilus asiaticus]|nr:septum formation protein Maf [Candidatus Amoebophilus asiaticus]